MLDFFNAEHIALVPPLLAYSSLFLVCVLEGVPIVGSLVAGGTITFMVGTVAATGAIDPIVAMVIATVGSFLGDVTGFLLLRFYGERVPALRTLIKGVRDNQGWLSDTFDRGYFAITVFVRLIPFVRSAPSLIAAVRAVSVRGYIAASAVASALWAVTGIAAGYGLSKIIDPKYIMAAVILISVISALYGLFRHVVSSHKRRKNASHS